MKRNSKLYRQIYVENYGRIPDGWVVHHINVDECDNRPENLIAMPERLHSFMHSKMHLTGQVPGRTEIQSFIKEWEDNCKRIENRFVMNRLNTKQNISGKT